MALASMGKIGELFVFSCSFPYVLSFVVAFLLYIWIGDMIFLAHYLWFGIFVLDIELC